MRSQRFVINFYPNRVLLSTSENLTITVFCVAKARPFSKLQNYFFLHFTIARDEGARMGIECGKKSDLLSAHLERYIK